MAAADGHLVYMDGITEAGRQTNLVAGSDDIVGAALAFELFVEPGERGAGDVDLAAAGQDGGIALGELVETAKYRRNALRAFEQ